jgi:hypothetical protein
MEQLLDNRQQGPLHALSPKRLRGGRKRERERKRRTSYIDSTPPSLNNTALKNVGCIWYAPFVIKNKWLYQKHILLGIPVRFAKAPQPFRPGGSSQFQYYPHLCFSLPFPWPWSHPWARCISDQQSFRFDATLFGVLSRALSFYLQSWLQCSSGTPFSVATHFASTHEKKFLHEYEQLE